MEMNSKQLLAAKKNIMKILRKPGNMPKGEVLELTLILDCRLQAVALNDMIVQLFSYLRKSGAPFMNMRINLLKCFPERTELYPISYSELLMGMAFSAKLLAEGETEEEPMAASDEEAAGEAAIEEDHPSEEAKEPLEAFSVVDILPLLRKKCPKSKVYLLITAALDKLPGELPEEEEEIAKKMLVCLGDGECSWVN